MQGLPTCLRTTTPPLPDNPSPPPRLDRTLSARMSSVATPDAVSTLAAVTVVRLLIWPARSAQSAAYSSRPAGGGGVVGVRWVTAAGAAWEGWQKVGDVQHAPGPPSSTHIKMRACTR